MDVTEIIAYPTKRDDWIKTLLIGGVLVFFSFLLVPILVVYGYVVRTIRRTLSGEPEPPIFDAWGELLVDGLQAWVISLVYLLIPLVVAGVTVGGSIVAIATGTEAGAAAGVGGLMLGLGLTSILLLVFGYLSVAAIVNFANEERFGAAFDFDRIKTVALDREYAIAWLVSVVILLVAGLVTAIPLIGWLLSPFVGFYAAVVAANLWAGGFDRALGSATVRGRTKSEDTAF